MAAGSLDIQARIDAVKDRADLRAVVDRRVKLKRAGRDWSACCPFHQEQTPSFTVVPDKGFYHCFGCGAHGDALRFVQEHDHVDFMTALQVLEAECGLGAGGVTPSPRPPAPKPAAPRATSRDSGFVDSALAGQTVWREGQRARGSLAETYLRHRAIDLDASGLLDVVRFHPRCPVRLWRRWEQPSAVESCEALLVPICRVEGEPGGRVFVQQAVEVVFLAPDGKRKKVFPSWRDRDGKEHRRPSRKIWGEARGGCCPIPPRMWMDWLDAEWLGAPGELVIGEGLESTHSLMDRLREQGDAVRGCCATLSLGNLQGGALANDRDGALPLWNLRADPARRPFVIDQAGAVAIGVDADMKGLKDRLVQERPKGPTIRRDLTGLERTMICEAVATAHWRLAGAAPVRVLRPRMGNDFNDEARRAA